MSKKLYEETSISDIADAIREKNGTQNQYTVAQMSEAVRSLKVGEVVIQPLNVAQNGTYTPQSGVDGYAPVTVNVSGGGGEFIIPIVGASSSYGEYTRQPYKAFGDVAGNFWGASSSNAWLNINFQTPYALSKILLSNYYSVSGKVYWYSQSIIVRASNDGFSTYTDLYTGTNLAQSETQFEIDLNNSAEYLEYRLIVDGGSSWAGLGRIVLL